jgi:sigma-E factor negative regulatory protein RseC
MSVEKGIVEKVENGFAYVRAQRKSACGSCASRSHCSSLHSGSNYMLVKTSNRLQARKGAMVSFQINSGTLLKYTFIVYIVPVMGLLLGALSASHLATFLGMNNDFESFDIPCLDVGYRHRQSTHQRPPAQAY